MIEHGGLADAAWLVELAVSLSASPSNIRDSCCPTHPHSPHTSQAGLVGPLIDLLQHDPDSRMQFEAAWAITNIASGTAEQTAVVIEGGCIPVFIQKLGSASKDVVRLPFFPFFLLLPRRGHTFPVSLPCPIFCLHFAPAPLA